jgi:hypothetical protein
MSDRAHRRLGGHVRRHSVAYVALVGMFALSPVPSMAAALVTTDQIANGAVTRPKLAADSVDGAKVVNEALTGADIKNGTINPAELADAAKGAKVVRYDLGDHNFSETDLVVQLPGTWSAGTVAGSSWSATLVYTDGLDEGDALSFVVPGPAISGASEYGLNVDNDGKVRIEVTSGFGEYFSAVRLYRTTVTSTQTAP